MCNKRTIILSTITYLLLTFTSSAQDTLSYATQNPLSIGLHLGYFMNFSGGEAKKGLDNMISTFEETGSDNFLIKGDLLYQLSPVVGLFANYKWNKKVSFGTGVNLTRRGYTMNLDAEEKDPEYQFDQFSEYTEKYQVTTIEVPLSVYFKPNKLFSLGVGIQAGTALAISSKVTSTINQRVVINGESSDEFPPHTREMEDTLDNIVSTAYFGYFASAGISLRKNTEIMLSLLKSGSYANTTYGKLSDTSVVVSLRFGLLSF